MKSFLVDAELISLLLHNLDFAAGFLSAAVRRGSSNGTAALFQSGHFAAAAHGGHFFIAAAPGQFRIRRIRRGHSRLQPQRHSLPRLQF